jgi:hypothetical protein
MKKVLLIAIAILFLVKDNNAQRLEQGSLDFVNGEKELNIIFDFSNVKINGRSEKEFIELQTIRGGEKWKNKWENTTKKVLFQKFVDYANLNLIGKYDLRIGDYPNANYQVNVKIITISEYGSVYADVKFSKINSDETLASLFISGSGGSFGTKENLMGDGFKRAGDKLGILLAKKLYKIEVKKARSN